MNINELKLFEKISKPQTKKRSLQIVVNRFYTTVDGTVIDKALAPAALQVDFPVYLFNEYDRRGGYFYGNLQFPSVVTAPYICTFVWGVNNPFFFGFNALSTIQNFLKNGDVITLYSDSLTNPSGYVWIVQTSRRSSIGAFYANLSEHGHFKLPYVQQDVEKTHLVTEQFKYFTSATSQQRKENQWLQAITVFNINSTGSVQVTNQMNPHTYKKPTTVNDGFILVPADFKLDQFFGLFTSILYTSDSIEFDFTIKN